MQTDAAPPTRHVTWSDLDEASPQQCSQASWQPLFDYTIYETISRYLNDHPEEQTTVEELRDRYRLTLPQAYACHYFKQAYPSSEWHESHNISPRIPCEDTLPAEQAQYNQSSDHKEVVSPEECAGNCDSPQQTTPTDAALSPVSHSSQLCIEDHAVQDKFDHPPAQHGLQIDIACAANEASSSCSKPRPLRHDIDVIASGSPDNHRGKRAAVRSAALSPKLQDLAQLMLMAPPSVSAAPWYFFSEEQAKHFLNDHLYAWASDLAADATPAKKQAKALLQHLWHAFLSSQQIAADDRGHAAWSTEPLAFVIEKLASLIRKNPQKSSEDLQRAIQGALPAMQAIVQTLEDDFTAPRYTQLVDTMTQQLVEWVIANKHHRDSIDVAAICHLVVPHSTQGFDATASHNLRALMCAGLWFDGWTRPLQATLFNMWDQGLAGCADLLKHAPNDIALTMLQEYADHLDATSHTPNQQAGLINTAAALLDNRFEARLAELCCQLLIRCDLSLVLPLLHGTYQNHTFARTVLRALERRLIAERLDDDTITDKLHPTLLNALKNPEAWLQPTPINAYNALELLKRIIRPLCQQQQHDDLLISKVFPEIALLALKASPRPDAAWETLHDMLSTIPAPHQITECIAKTWAYHRIMQKHIAGVICFFHRYDSSLTQAFQALSGQPHYLLKLYGSLYGEHNAEIAHLEINYQRVLPVLEAALWRALQSGLEATLQEPTASSSLSVQQTEHSDNSIDDRWQPDELLEHVADTLSNMDPTARTALITALGANSELIDLRRNIALAAKQAKLQSQSTLELLIAVSAEEEALDSETTALRPLIGKAMWAAIEQGEAQLIQRISYNKGYRHTILLCTCEELSRHHLTPTQLQLGEYLLRALEAEPEHFLVIKRSSPDLLIQELMRTIMRGEPTSKIIRTLEQYCLCHKNSSDSTSSLVRAWNQLIALAAHPETDGAALQKLLTILSASEDLEALCGDAWQRIRDRDPVGAACVAQAMMLHDPGSPLAFELLHTSLPGIFHGDEYTWRHFIDVGIESDKQNAGSFQRLPKQDMYSFIHWLLHVIKPNGLSKEQQQVLYRRLTALTCQAEALRLLSPFPSVLKEALKTAAASGSYDQLESLSRAILVQYAWFRKFTHAEQQHIVEQIAEELMPSKLANSKIHLKEFSSTALWSWAVTNRLFKIATDFELNPEALHNHMTTWDLRIIPSAEGLLTNYECLNILQNSTDVLEGLGEVPAKNRLWHRLAKRLLVGGIAPEELFGNTPDSHRQHWPKILQHAQDTIISGRQCSESILHPFQRYAFACCMGEPTARLEELETPLSEISRTEHLNPTQFEATAVKLMIKAMHGIHEQSFTLQTDAQNMHQLQKLCRGLLSKICALCYQSDFRPVAIYQVQQWQMQVIQTICDHTDQLRYDKEAVQRWALSHSWLIGTYVNIIHHPAHQSAPIELLHAAEALLNKTAHLIAGEAALDLLNHKIEDCQPAIGHLLPHVRSTKGTQQILKMSLTCAGSLYINLIPTLLRAVASALDENPMHAATQAIAANVTHSLLEIMLAAPVHAATTARRLPVHSAVQHFSDAEWLDKLTPTGEHSIWQYNAFSIPETLFHQNSVPNVALCDTPSTFVSLHTVANMLRVHNNFDLWQGCAYLMLMLNEGILRSVTISPNHIDLNSISIYILESIVDTLDCLEHNSKPDSSKFSVEQQEICSNLLTRCIESSIDSLTILTPLMIDGNTFETLENAINNVSRIAQSNNCQNICKLSAILDLLMLCSSPHDQDEEAPSILTAAQEILSEVHHCPLQQRVFLECLIKGFSYFADSMNSALSEHLLRATICAWLKSGIVIQHNSLEHPLIQPLGAQMSSRLLLATEMMRCLLTDDSGANHSCESLSPAQQILFFHILDWSISDLVIVASLGRAEEGGCSGNRTVPIYRRPLEWSHSLEHTALLLRKDNFTYLLAHIEQRMQPQFPYGQWYGSQRTSERHVQRLISDMEFFRTNLRW